ncbi:LacI family DNA-binding transcriptional regulator [Egicoccus halophilus]|uniref:LacI family transcriptional regulator n=1 Tax=Egicoccus halophilus TaxID=1670830 RepID=A0A8J3ABW2_9ACTN|nr:LacI family DNA-binding transcriptional regulator [Egicoccus halophilus]GGI07940.1 LacI family transcriptional regulator [Egicoccus halophilus]
MTPRPGRITIADVARAAGVSRSAVSFALNDRPGIGTDTRARILRVADELGWRPSARARALASDRANAVGFVFARPVELLSADPFFSQFLAGLEMVLSPLDQALVLQVITGGQEAEAAAYRRMAHAGRVDGFVLTDAREDDPRFAVLEGTGLPAVLAGDATAQTPYPTLGPDESAGTTMAVRHLLELGHRRIAYVAGPSNMQHARRRRDAWHDAMVAAGHEPDLLVHSDFTGPGGAAATEQLLDGPQPPTAIVYANDLMATAGMASLHRDGWRIPDEVSVIGYDDITLAAHTSPPLTTVRQDVVGIGRLVAAELLARIGGVPVATPPLRNPELVVRDTTAPPPSGPPRARRSRGR